MKKILLFLLTVSFLITGCTNVPTYKVKISKMSHLYYTSSQIMKDIEAVDDTTAFTEAVRIYWAEKFINQNTNKLLHQTAEKSSLQEPYNFTVYRFIKNDSSIVNFDSALATHLATPIIDQVRRDVEKMFKGYDSINNKPEAKIY